MHKHTPQNTECFNWQLWMEVLYVRTICGAHDHLWYLREITKSVRIQIIGKSIMQVPQNTGIAVVPGAWGVLNLWTTTATLPTSVYYLHLYNFEIKIQCVLGISHCRMQNAILESTKIEFKLCHSLLQDKKSIRTLKHFLQVLR